MNNSSLNCYTGLSNKLNTNITDSLSAIKSAKNPVNQAKTKHVDITYHFDRENLLSNNEDLVYEDTSVLLADNLTKATSIPELKAFISKIRLVEVRN